MGRGNIDRYVTFGQGFVGLIRGLAWKTAHHADLANLTCNEQRRGWEFRVEGAAGTADRFVRCEKDAANAYAWTETGLAALDARYVNTLLPTDPNADRIYFWDDSAGSEAYLTPDATDFAISGTTLALGSAPSFSDFTNAQHDHQDADDGGTLTRAAIANFTHTHAPTVTVRTGSGTVNNASATTVTAGRSPLAAASTPIPRRRTSPVTRVSQTALPPRPAGTSSVATTRAALSALMST